MRQFSETFFEVVLFKKLHSRYVFIFQPGIGQMSKARDPRLDLISPYTVSPPSGRGVELFSAAGKNVKFQCSTSFVSKHETPSINVCYLLGRRPQKAITNYPGLNFIEPLTVRFSFDSAANR